MAPELNYPFRGDFNPGVAVRQSKGHSLIENVPENCLAGPQEMKSVPCFRHNYGLGLCEGFALIALLGSCYHERKDNRWPSLRKVSLDSCNQDLI